ncbi:MAG TPA: DUF370 domain-containing protein [Firmicutes bacterium]|nr:DUF370 domain-containing protein [Bacillota bacterium]
MYLHIGRDVTVPVKKIVALIGIQDPVNYRANHQFIDTAREEGFVVHLGSKPRTLVLLDQEVYVSPISVATLKRRLQSINSTPQLTLSAPSDKP